MADKIPDNAYVLIIGAMKCGTTSLYNYLQDHPQICPAVNKEPEFFSERQAHGVQVNRYSDLWDFNASMHKYVMEASTGYTKFPYEQNIPARIFLHGIRPKFIYIIRNPYDRIASNYHFIKALQGHYPDILDPHLIEVSDYFLQLEQYRKYFPLEDILLLDFAELTSNPTLTMHKIYRFLGLSLNHLPAKFSIKNATPLPFESSVYNLLTKYRVNLLYQFLPQALRQGVKLLLHKMSPSTERPLTIAEKEFVHAKLQDGMANLYHTYGFDVRQWGFNI